MCLPYGRIATILMAAVSQSGPLACLRARWSAETNRPVVSRWDGSRCSERRLTRLELCGARVWRDVRLGRCQPQRNEGLDGLDRSSPRLVSGWLR
jgi:hypothetical protein